MFEPAQRGGAEPADDEVAVEVSPFGSESYGAAVVTLTGEAGTDRAVCIVDKATKAAELTAPWPAVP